MYVRKDSLTMLQPFDPFKATYIPRLLELKRHWLVFQTYTRYNDHVEHDPKTSLLVTDYDDASLAKAHLKALNGDKYAALLDLTVPAHKAKFIELLGADSRFHVFWSVIKCAKALEDKLNRDYKENIRRYVTNNTSWRISRDNTLRPALLAIFGALYIIIKYGGQTIRVKFEDIETA